MSNYWRVKHKSTLNDINTKSQCEKVLAGLQADKRITQLNTSSRYGSFGLGAHVYDLKQLGYPIDKVNIKNEQNDKHYAQNFMRVN
ncbi:helix-turn-helix domain-containing protein [Orbus wheelerorum]|uniref:helix-turn-helix domain-containing protein n=1 Tax=Orbus wheelerorum TaxID=3074111 RepID=UPI00370DB1FB